MRKWIFVLMLVSASAFASQKEASLFVEGMSCVSCASAIEKRLRAFPEVASVNISMNTGRVSVSFKDGKSLSRETIQKAIEETGYKVKPASAK